MILENKRDCDVFLLLDAELNSSTMKGAIEDILTSNYDSSYITKQPSYHSHTYHCLFTDAITSLVSEEQRYKSN